MTSLDLSVVIGFRDWGVERLRRSVASLAGAMGDLSGEIIISDYGSADPSLSRDVAQSQGARWVSTPGDPVWSRSRALNAGLAMAQGTLLVSTDADMLFSPETLEAVHAEATNGAPCAVFLQCRDLPEDLPDSALDVVNEIPWTDLERRSRLRPRWGMGGLMAIDRDGFSLLHGYDERLQIYGREDLDFALRARRSGRRVHWVSDPRARMYHMWHPPTLAKMEETESGRQAMARNRRIVDSDMTTSRNLRSRRLLPDGRPLVSIIVTEVRDADELHRTIATALAQTVRDIEVLVCGDSHLQNSHAQEDQRLRGLTIPEESLDELSVAICASRGSYISVVRSGDLLPLDRTEKLLSAMVEGCNGVVGSTVQLEDDGALRRTAGSPDHTSSLVRREGAETLAYSMRARSSNTNFFGKPFRRAGFVLAEVESPTLLTLHTAAPSDLAADVLAEPVALTLRALLPAECEGAEERTAVVSRLHGDASWLDLDGEVEREEVTFGDTTISGGVTVRGASYADLVSLSQLPGDLTVEPSSSIAIGPRSSWLSQIIEHSLANGAVLPLTLHLRHESASAASEPTPYKVHSTGQVLVINAVAHQIATPLSTEPLPRRPWMLIGAEIEEVWS